MSGASGFGFPSIAAAAVISQLLSAVLVAIVLARPKEAYSISVKALCFDVPLFRRMMYIGIPNGCSLSCTASQTV